MNLCSTPPVCHSWCKHSLHAGLITRPLYEVKSRNETWREKERERCLGKDTRSMVSQEICTNISNIYLCANDLQWNGHYIFH